MFNSNNKQKQKHNNYPPCTNCGITGHSYRHCLAPVNSYGLIAFRIKNKEWNTSKELMNSKLITGMENAQIEFLLIQRKDSLRFVDFTRGKYAVDDKEYLSQMFSNMTNKERDFIKNNTFDDLWKHVWGTVGMSKNKPKGDEVDENKEHKETYNKHNFGNTHKSDYEQSKQKFSKLKEEGILDSILSTTTSIWNTPEWGFPKGRRNPNETDIESAIREFKEETGLESSNFNVISNMEPLTETFYGDNKVHYCHTYYLAQCDTDANISFDSANPHMVKEIGDIAWCSLEEALARIRSENIEKREILLRASAILRNYCVFNT
jgi:8-oxo-dGTP pyrophosphatase MutT (NUDIX family)